MIGLCVDKNENAQKRNVSLESEKKIFIDDTLLAKPNKTKVVQVKWPNPTAKLELERRLSLLVITNTKPISENLWISCRADQEASLAFCTNAAEQRMEAMKAKTPKPMMRENPATTKSITDCTLRPIIFAF